MTRPGRVVVVGVGNPWRGDDGVGQAVTAVLRDGVRPRGVTDDAAGATGGFEVVDLDGDAARILDAWDGADLAVVVDAVRTGATAGAVQRLDAGDLAAASTASSHALGVEHAVALGRALGRLPRRLVVVGVEGADFTHGAPLSAPVAAAVQPAARLVAELVAGRS